MRSTAYAHAEAFGGGTSTDNPLLAMPHQLQQSFEGALSSVRLAQFFVVREEPEWVDDAPMQLIRRGRVRLRLQGARQMEFSSVGDEFSDEG